MNEQAIDTVILPQAEEQVINLTKLLSDLDIQMANSIKTANGLNTAVLNSKSFSEFSANTAKATASIESVQKAHTEATTKIIANNKQREAIEEKRNKTIISNSQAEVDAYKKAANGEAGITETVNKRNKAEAQAANEATGRSAKVVSQQQAQAKEYIRAQGLIEAATVKLERYKILSQGATNPDQLQKYNKKIQETQTIISQLSNVGKEGFDSLGNAIKNSGNFAQKAFSYVRQLAYILPGVGVAGIIGFATGPIIDYITQLDLFKGKLTSAKAIFDSFNEVNKEANQTYAKESTELKILYNAATDVSNSMKSRHDAADALQKQWPETFKNFSDEDILLGKAKTGYDDLTKSLYENAKARAALAKIEKLAADNLDADIQKQKIEYAQAAELRRSKLDEANGKFDVEGGGILAGENEKKIKERADNAKKVQDARIKINNDQIEFLTKLAGGNNKIADALSGGGSGKSEKDMTNTDLLEYNRLQLLQQQKIAKAILDDDKVSYEMRKDALDDYLKKSQQLLDNGEKIALSQDGLRKQQRLNIELEYQNKAKDLKIEGNKELEKLDNSEVERHKKLIAELVTTDEQAQQEQLENLNQGAIIAEQALQGARDKLINEKNEAYAKGKISEKEYNRDLLAINDQYAIDRISQELALQNAILAIQEATRDKELSEASANKATPEELAKITSNANKGITGTKNKIGDLTIQLGNAKSKQTVDQTKSPKSEEKEAADNAKRVQQAIADATIQGIDTVEQFRQKAHEAEIARLEEQARLIEENAEAQKTIINNSLASEKTKNRQIQLLDAQTASQKKAIIVAENKEKNKAAKEDKIATIGKIIASSALAFVQALAAPFPLDTILPPIIAASSALQLATAIAAPLPKYEKGGKWQPGLGLWGESGVERANLPDGSVRYSTGPEITSFPLGTVITPHLELMQQLKPAPVNYVGGEQIGWGEVVKQLKKMDSGKGKQVIRVNVDGSFEKYKRNYLTR